MTEPAVPLSSASGAGPTIRRLRRPPTWLWVLVFFLAITTLYLVQWISQTDAWAGGLGDEVLETWYLGWVPWAITHGHNPLITNLIDYPSGVNLMWNTSLPLLGILGAPINWLFGPRVEYHVWLTLGIALSGFFAYVFVSRRTRLVPALVCGVIYGFSPFMTFHATGHLHEVFAVTPPLLLILFDDLLVRRVRSAPRTGVYLGLVVAAQLLIGEEVLATELLMGPLILAVLVVLRRRDVPAQLSTGAARLGRALVVASAVAVPIVAAPLLVQFFGPQRITGVVQARDFYVTDFLNLIVPNREWLQPQRAAQIAAHFNGESNAYISVPGFLLVGGILLALRRSRVAWWAALGMGVALLLSLGPRLHFDGRNTGIRLPGSIIDAIPVLENILPARFSLYVFLFMGILVALGLEAAWAMAARRRGPLALTGVMTLATVAALSPRVPMPVMAHTIPPFFSGPSAARIPEGSVVLVAPWPIGYFSSTAGTAAAPMLWQQTAGYRFAMPAGYAVVPAAGGAATFFAPAGGLVELELLNIWNLGVAVQPPDPSARAAMLATLRSWHLAAIVVGPMQNRPVAVQYVTTLVGRGPEEVGGVELWMGPFG